MSAARLLLSYFTEYGFAAAVAKPFNLKDLQTIISQVLA